MIYVNNEDIKNYLKSILDSEKTNFTELSKMLNISRQQLYNKFNKVNLSFNDIKEICDTIDYNLNITFTKKVNDKAQCINIENLTNDERELIINYRKCNETGKERIHEQVSFMSEHFPVLMDKSSQSKIG